MTFFFGWGFWPAEEKPEKNLEISWVLGNAPKCKKKSLDSQASLLPPRSSHIWASLASIGDAEDQVGGTGRQASSIIDRPKPLKVIFMFL